MLGSDDFLSYGQFWTTLPDWPVAKYTPCMSASLLVCALLCPSFFFPHTPRVTDYLHADRSLSTSAPTEATSATSYIYDPAVC